MRSKNVAPPPAIVVAAEALEAEMQRCEEALADGEKLRLTSGKNVGRAARALQAAAECHSALGGKVSALLEAINGVRARADRAAGRMETRATEIQARQARLKLLQDRSGEIALAVRDVTESAKSSKPADLLTKLAPVQEAVGRLLEESRGEGFEDVTRDIDGLRQMLESVRSKLAGY